MRRQSLEKHLCRPCREEARRARWDLTRLVACGDCRRILETLRHRELEDHRRREEERPADWGLKTWRSDS